MKVSTRTRYGLRAMIQIAQGQSRGPVQVKLIAQEQDLSGKYLEQLLALLKSAGFVRSVRGAKGGYVLAKLPHEITVKEIFDVLEGPIVPAECLESNQSCQRSPQCSTKWLWEKLQTEMDNTLKSVTLRDLVDRAKNSSTLNYQI